MEVTKSLCIIVPCYNEEKRFPRKDFHDFLETNTPKISICLVNDGSTDGTYTMLKEFEDRYPGSVSILNLQENSGKAEALRKAFLSCVEGNRFDYLAYLDADLATSLDEIVRIFREVSIKPNVVLGMGARWQHLGADIQRSNVRHYFGRFFATMASIILKLPVYDTQCGAKVIKSDIVQDVFSANFISKWIFDVEIIGRIINNVGLDKTRECIIEVPLKAWSEIGDSKITFRDLTRIPYDLFKIARKY